VCGCLCAADEIHRPKAVDTLVLTNDVDVASTSFLKIPDGLSTAPDDEANRPIRDNDLNAVLSFTERRLVVLILRAPSTATASATASATTTVACWRGFFRWVAAVLINDSVDFPLGVNTSAWIAGDLALPLRARCIRPGDELDASTGVLLHAPQILSLSTNY
jgi:hypothetical protein